MNELWEWPYEPEIDRHGFARAPIPETARSFLEVGRKVQLVTPSGEVLNGVVREFSRNAWVARVKVGDVHHD